jgi:diguanylate cyclase (GGDEF)-like protein
MKVLVIGKEESILEQLGEQVEQCGCTPVFTDDFSVAYEAIDQVDMEICAIVIDDLIDDKHPQYSQQDIQMFLNSMREMNGTIYPYILVITPILSKEKQLQLLQSGADCVLDAPISFVHVGVQLQVAKRMIEFQQRQLHVQEDLWNQANYDPLTEIPNRRSILQNLQRLGGLAVQREQPLGILMLDLDHFKRINDTYGHDCGDVVLKESASRMKQSLRNSDMVGRFGGEEFLVLIPNCVGEELIRLAERIRVSVNKPVAYNDKLIPVSCSVGVAVYYDPQEDVHEILQRADKALYVAKAMGRNRVVCAWMLNEYYQNIS